MSSRPGEIVEFPPYSFDLASGELRKNGRKLKLHPQPAKVLTILVRRAGEVARREEIQKEVWGNDTYVEFDLGINSCIRQIRAALGTTRSIHVSSRRFRGKAIGSWHLSRRPSQTRSRARAVEG